MEPMNATAHIANGRAEIWAPTQAGAQCRQQVASALGFPVESVTVHPCLMGGGFGRRLQNDYAIEAALIARETGAPVKVIWSREEDFLRTTLRTAAKARLRAALEKNGKPIQLSVDLATLDPDRKTAGLDDHPYEFALAVNYAGTDSAARIGPWRSVDYSHNIYFLERFVDECARAAGADPIAYRLAMLKPGSRSARTLQALASCCRDSVAAGPTPRFGVAFCHAFGSYVAAAIEVEADPQNATTARVKAIHLVADCGLVVDPDSVRAQLEGGALQALSAARDERITLRAGRINETGFDRYQIARMAATPRVQITLLEGGQSEPGGVGELAVPVIAPALANAWASVPAVLGYASTLRD
jgi:isoquinoline 1-oxidoreductase beta subunit